MDNIIPFPNLRQRLLERGLEALQVKQYKKALHFFYEAEKLEPNDPEVELSMIICLFELGEWEEAKERCCRLLEEQKVDDTELLPIYLSILIQLKQYKQAEAMIYKALQNRHLSPSLRDHFIQLLQLVGKMNTPLSSTSYYNEEIRQLLKSERLTDQMKAIKQLEEKEEIEALLPILKQYLNEENNHPMAKTMVLRLLTEKKVREAITITKFGETMTVVPAQLDESIETKFAAGVLERLERDLANDNPSLYEMASEIWLRYVYILYPFSAAFSSCEAWAAALHLTACHLQGSAEPLEGIAERYGASVEEVETLYKKLYEIEEISCI
ncbi:tetratricopeptide repeat protein [Anoxybacteroides tepidamans]|uniref:tetratricopeptide repeat protein n=1 Tax=Anoxybacteroides tepidamans TaxID=265948 RepID=UPI00048432BB|nr:tetratricopeptide repeat protein [Anoxybacillus tepidamans]